MQVPLLCMETREKRAGERGEEERSGIGKWEWGRRGRGGRRSGRSEKREERLQLSILSFVGHWLTSCYSHHWKLVWKATVYTWHYLLCLLISSHCCGILVNMSCLLFNNYAPVEDCCLVSGMHIHHLEIFLGQLFHRSGQRRALLIPHGGGPLLFLR